SGVERAVVRRPLPGPPRTRRPPLPAAARRSGRGRGRGAGGVPEAAPRGPAAPRRPQCPGPGAGRRGGAPRACRDRRPSGWWRRWWSVSAPLDETSVASPFRTPEGEVVSADQQRRIWRAFEHLAPRQREVFVLRHVEGWSTQEVADALGVETGSVKRHLFRAVRRLRASLGDSAGEDPVAVI